MTAKAKIPEIIQVGAVPPPFGGVSIHTKRLMGRLCEAKLANSLIDVSGVPKTGLGIRNLSWKRAFLHLLRCEPAIVHFHNFAPRNLYLFSLLSIRHLTVVSLHNERFDDDIRKYSPIEQWLLVRLFDSITAVVVHSETSRERALKLGIPEAKLHVIPPFILPAPEDTADLTLPPIVEELRRKRRYLLATNAFRLTFHKGEDLYGIDLVIEATGDLVNDAKLDVAAVILLPDAGDTEYLQKLKQRVRELGLEERCLFHCESLEETTALWKSADIVIRATNTDAGDSLTVLEALACGTPAIASDCVLRNEAAHLFVNRDAKSLAAVCKQVLDDLPASRAKLKSIRLSDNAGSLIELYLKIAGAGTTMSQRQGV